MSLFTTSTYLILSLPLCFVIPSLDIKKKKKDTQTKLLEMQKNSKLLAFWLNLYKLFYLKHTHTHKHKHKHKTIFFRECNK